jgi:hypothetical protein
MKFNSGRRLRGFETLVPTAQMFHGLGKGLGRGCGPNLAEVPVPKKGRPVIKSREGTEIWHATLVG